MTALQISVLSPQVLRYFVKRMNVEAELICKHIEKQSLLSLSPSVMEACCDLGEQKDPLPTCALSSAHGASIWAQTKGAVIQASPPKTPD